MTDSGVEDRGCGDCLSPTLPWAGGGARIPRLPALKFSGLGDDWTWQFGGPRGRMHLFGMRTFSLPLGTNSALFTLEPEILDCSCEPSGCLAAQGEDCSPPVSHLHEGSGGLGLRAEEGSEQTTTSFRP